MSASFIKTSFPKMRENLKLYYNIKCLRFVIYKLPIYKKNHNQIIQMFI